MIVVVATFDFPLGATVRVLELAADSDEYWKALLP